MRFKQYLNDQQIEDIDISYDVYCDAIDKIMENNLDESLFDGIKNIKGSIVKVFTDLKDTIKELSNQFKLSIKDIVIAFKQRDVFMLLKTIGFKIKVLFKSINALTKAVRGGLFSIFAEISNSGIMKKIKSGTMKIDDFLNKYPKLKKISGIVIAGLLLYMWLNMTFIGDLDYDFNFLDISNALKGSFSITDLFLSPSGIMLISLFATGSGLGISVPWLGASLYNFTLAIVYTGFIKNRSKGINIISIKNKIKSFKLK